MPGNEARACGQEAYGGNHCLENRFSVKQSIEIMLAFRLPGDNLTSDPDIINRGCNVKAIACDGCAISKDQSWGMCLTGTGKPPRRGWNGAFANMSPALKDCNSRKQKAHISP